MGLADPSHPIDPMLILTIILGIVVCMILVLVGQLIVVLWSREDLGASHAVKPQPIEGHKSSTGDDR